MKITFPILHGNKTETFLLIFVATVLILSCAQPLSKQLLSDKPEIRTAAIEKAMALSEEEFNMQVIEPVLVAVNQGEIDSAAVYELFSKFGEKGIPGLETLLESNRKSLRSIAIRIISEQHIFTEKIIETLFRYSEGDNLKLKMRALGILFEYEPITDEQVERIGKHISDSNLEIRRMIIEYLRTRRSLPESLIPDLIATLGDDDFMVRQKARFCLGKMGVSAIGGLLEELKKPDNEIRQSVANILGDMGAKASQSADELYAQLKSEDEDVRLSAARALQKMKGLKRDQIPEIIKMIRSSSGKFRRVLGDMLGTFSRDEIPLIYPYLKDEELRSYVLKAIDKIDPPQKANPSSLINLFNRDALSYFPQSKYSTPLRKKQFMNSDEYKQKEEQLQKEKDQAKNQRYYLRIPAKIPEYNVKKGRFELFLGSYGAGYDPRKERIPKCIDKFRFNKLPISTKKNFKGYPKSYREEYLNIPVPEETAMIITENNHNVEVGVYFYLTGIKDGSHTFQNVSNKATFNIKYTFVTTRDPILVLKNRKTGEIYFYREY